MNLYSKTFNLSYDDDLSIISNFFSNEIGTSVYLIQQVLLNAENYNNIKLTILYYKDTDYPLGDSDDLKFTEIGNSYYYQSIVNIPLSPIVSGAVTVTGQILDSSNINLPSGFNDQLLELNLSSYSAEDLVEINLDNAYLSGRAGEQFLNDTSIWTRIDEQAYLDKDNKPDETTRAPKGRLRVGRTRFSRNTNVDAIISEINQVGHLLLWSVAHITRLTDIIYYFYVVDQEPCLVNSFPANNSRLVIGYMPNDLILRYDAPILADSLSGNPYYIYSGFNNYSIIDSSNLNLSADNLTVVIGLSGYVKSPGIYNVVSTTGLRSISGIYCTSPSKITLYVDSGMYDGGAQLTYSGSGVVDLPYMLYTDPIIIPNNYKVLVAGSGISTEDSSKYRTYHVSNYSSITGHLSDNSIHYTTGEISISSSQVSNFNSTTLGLLNPLSGDFTGHVGNTGVHYLQSDIIITESQISDLKSYALASDYTGFTGQVGNVSKLVYTDGSRGFTSAQSGVSPTQSYHLATRGYVDSSVAGITGGGGASTSGSYITWDTDNPSLSNFRNLTGRTGIAITNDGTSVVLDSTFYGNFTGHSGDASIHYTQGSISITSSQVSNFDSSVNSLTLNISGKLDSLSGNYISHTGNSTIHFTQAQISIPSSQITDFSSQVNTIVDPISTKLDSVSGTFTGHTGDSTVHFTQAQISITESQISNLGSYATNAKVNAISGVLVAHTGDSTVHFTQASISIPSTQISDWSEAVDDRVSTLLSGATGIGVNYIDASNVLYIYVTGLGHQNLTGLTNDDHSKYIYKSPAGSSRNTISPTDDYTALSINQSIAGTSSDIFVITNGALVKKVYVDGTGYLSIVNNPTASTHAVNLSYLTSNYTSSSTFTGYTGQVGSTSKLVYTDGTRGFTSAISGQDPTNSYDLATKHYVDINVGGSGSSPGGQTNSIQFNDAGSFGGAAGLYWNSSNSSLTLSGSAPYLSLTVGTGDPSVPASGYLDIYAKKIAGRSFPKWMGSAGLDTPFQPSLFSNRISLALPGATTAVSSVGLTLATAVGTRSTPTPTSTNFSSQIFRTQVVSAATTNSAAEEKATVLQCWRGNSTGFGGFFFSTRFATWSSTALQRWFFGLLGTVSAISTSQDPATLTNCIGIGCASGDNNLQFLTNDGAGSCTKTDLGSSFPVQGTGWYDLTLFCKPNDSQIEYRIQRFDVTPLVEVTGFADPSNLPTSTTFLCPHLYGNNGGTAAAVTFAWNRIYIESDY